MRAATPRARQRAADGDGELPGLARQRIPVVVVDVERPLVADRPNDTVGHHPTVVAPRGEVEQRRAVRFAEQRDEPLPPDEAEVPHRRHADPPQSLRGGGPDPGNRPDGVGVQEGELVAGNDEDDPGPRVEPVRSDPGLRGLRRQLGDEFGPADADGTGEPEVVQHPSAQARRDRPTVAEQPVRTGHVEEGLVDRDRLDDRRDVVTDPDEALAHLLVLVVTPRDDDETRDSDGAPRPIGIAERTPKTRAS